MMIYLATDFCDKNTFYKNLQQNEVKRHRGVSELTSEFIPWTHLSFKRYPRATDLGLVRNIEEILYTSIPE
jgi:hypothetical protein